MSKELKIERYPFICQAPFEFAKMLCISANQTPDYVISFGKWYAIYPDHSECLGPTGRLDLGADYDGETKLEKQIRILAKELGHI